MKTFEDYKKLLDDLIEEMEYTPTCNIPNNENYQKILAIFHNYISIKTLKANDLLIRFAQACKSAPDLENLSEIGKLAGTEIMRKLYELEKLEMIARGEGC